MAVYEIVLEGRIAGNDNLNVIHYDVPGSTPPDFTAIANIFEAQLDAHIAPLCGANVVWVGLTWRLDEPGQVGVSVPFTGGAVIGTKADAQVLSFAAVLVRKLTNNGVRPARGRAFMGGMDAAFSLPTGGWETAMLDEVQDFWEAIRVLSLPASVTAQMVIKASNPTAPNTVPYNTVSGITVVANPTTMKSRKLMSGS